MPHNDVSTFVQTLNSGIAVGSLYALIALGYTLVFGILQFINFAHGDVFALGAWLSLTLANYADKKIKAGFVNSVALLLLVPMAVMLLCAFTGFCIERFAYRPLRSAPKLNVLITAIGVSLLLENLGAQSWAFGSKPGPVPILINDQSPLLTIARVPIHRVDVIVLAVAVTLMVGIQWLIYRTKLGTAMRAVSFNAKTASLMGINVDRVISVTFVVGSALAGAAGYLYAMKYQGGTLNQTAAAMWILLGMKAFVAAVVGGIGNIRGAMAGGLLIGLVENFGAVYTQHIAIRGWSIELGSAYKDVFVFALLIVVLLVRPAGLFGRATVEKV